MMCSLAGNATSLHRAPDCPVLSWHSACPNEASTSFLRLSEPSPAVWRFCRAAANCSRPGRGCDDRQQVVLGFLQRVEAFSPLVLRLWLHICEDVLQHELEQLGMVFIFALLFLRFSSRVPNLEFITVLCTMRINFEPARSHVRSQPVSGESQMFLCHYLQRESQRGRVFTRSPGIIPWQFLHIHCPH